MTDAERERFATMIDALDLRVASRPDILESPAGFVIGALVGAGRHDPADAWQQLAGFADLLAYIVMYVRGTDGATVDAILDSMFPIPAG